MELTPSRTEPAGRALLCAERTGLDPVQVLSGRPPGPHTAYLHVRAALQWSRTEQPRQAGCP